MQLNTFTSLKGNPDQFNTLTSLMPKELDQLLSYFSMVCEPYFIYHDLRGARRKSPRFKERKDCSLYGSKMKLLFLLTYLKENANQHYQGFLFCIYQARMSQWAKVLRPLLVKTLRQMQQLPLQGASKLLSLLEDSPQAVLLVDCCVRSILRPCEQEVQKSHYSGKKKRHTINNLALTNNSGRVLYLSKSYEGAMHDKKIYDEQQLLLLQLHQGF